MVAMSILVGCGYNIYRIAHPQTRVSVRVAGVLALFIGWL